MSDFSSAGGAENSSFFSAASDVGGTSMGKGQRSCHIMCTHTMRSYGRVMYQFGEDTEEDGRIIANKREHVSMHAHVCVSAS